MSDHPDRARLQKLLDDFFDRLEEEAEQYPGDIRPEDISIDEAAIISVSTVRDEDGDLAESYPMLFTTSRRFAQFGLLDSAVEEHKKQTWFPREQDDED